MTGSFAISKLEVDLNNFRWGVFDFVIHHLNTQYSGKAGWYSYKLIDGIYYFKIATHGKLPPLSYRRALKKDKWHISPAYL